jgi:signal transduction histidine kinase/CheY-like chemotaxis protein
MMRADRQNKTLPAIRIIVLACLTGILLLTVVFFISTRTAYTDGERILSETLTFMKQQCLRYDNLTASEETRDQIQLLDKTRELGRCLAQMKSEEYENFLKIYTDDQRISGVILMDSSMQLTAECHNGNLRLQDWDDLLHDPNLLDVMKYAKKVYVSRVERSDSRIYDYAAIGMPEQEGLLLCYTLKVPNAADDNQLRLDNIFSGYHLDMDGLILVTDKEKILSSNAEELQGSTIAAFPLISEHSGEISADSSCMVEQDGIRYLVRSGKCRSYGLYAFFPEKEVFRHRSVQMAYALIFYVFLLLLMVLMNQRETRRSNQLKMNFLRQMCHDIRTPINGIRGMVRIGNHFPEDMEKQKECRDKIWKASGLLMDLINDVLDMGKLEAGEIALEEKPFNLKELIQEIAAVMEPQAQDQKVELSIDRMEGEHWALIGSPIHIRRMLSNIISNAIKYNQKGGLVRISCTELSQNSSEHTTSFEIVCADTGIGMSREFQKHMFKQFTQEKSAGEISHHGTGLGLAIVRSLVQEMKGTIRCESEQGKGTTFYITLPLVIDETAQTQEQADEVPEEAGNYEQPRQLAGISVLLVEDNELNMEVAEFILEEEGILVTKARNGLEAVQIFEASEPGSFQFILMDIQMPVMDGETAARTIRAMNREDAAKIPIIAMTANAFEEDIRRALQSGINAHISKPIAPEHLIQVMKYHFQIEYT